MLFIGLISGTSVDGIDAALVRCNEPAAPELIAGITEPYPKSLSQRLKTAMHSTSIDYAELCELDTAVAEAFAVAALKLSAQRPENEQIVAIGSHGQTLFHHPTATHPNSLQIGNPSVIAQRTGIDTVADFRRADIARGGQGAPLLPALHQRLFGHATTTRAVLNLGGIANITVLPAGSAAPSFGFDTGPANTLLDAWVLHWLGEPLDEDARWSQGGQVVSTILDTLLADPYFAKQPPKSTGVEYFNMAWLRQAVPSLEQHDARDVARTLVLVSALSAANAVNATDARELYAVGGGAHNPLMMSDLKAHCRARVRPAHAAGVDVDYLEAMAFAWFARCYLDGHAAMSPTVTGASQPVVLGGLYPGGLLIE